MKNIYPTSLAAAIPDRARIDKAKKELEKAGVKYVFSCWIDILGSAKTKPVPVSEFENLCLGKGPQFAVHSVSMFPELGAADPDQFLSPISMRFSYVPGTPNTRSSLPIFFTRTRRMTFARAWL